MTSNQRWYLEYKKNPFSTIRLFCFHHSGGGASAYYPWLEYLSPNIEMVTIQLPGRENRFTEKLNNNLKSIIDELSKEFHLYTDKPFFFFGHSLGGLISYEFTKSIYKHYSLYPFHMVISSTKAPHLPLRRNTLSQLTDIDLKNEIIHYNGLDEQIIINNEIFDLFLPIIRSDFSIYENYCYAESKLLPCDILALSGSHDQTVNEEEILAWAAHTTGNFKHSLFSGGHFFIKKHQKAILEIINQIGNSYILK